MVLFLATLKTYDYVSENVGLKLSTKIELFKKQNVSYPADLSSIKESANLNLIEKIFFNRVRYKVSEDDYELRTINLLNKERTYDQDTEEWE